MKEVDDTIIDVSSKELLEYLASVSSFNYTFSYLRSRGEKVKNLPIINFDLNDSNTDNGQKYLAANVVVMPILVGDGDLGERYNGYTIKVNLRDTEFDYLQDVSFSSFDDRKDELFDRSLQTHEDSFSAAMEVVQEVITDIEEKHIDSYKFDVGRT